MINGSLIFSFDIKILNFVPFMYSTSCSEFRSTIFLLTFKLYKAPCIWIEPKCEINIHGLICSFWNFDALFQPQQHPARDSHDTFFLQGLFNLVASFHSLFIYVATSSFILITTWNCTCSSFNYKATAGRLCWASEAGSWVWRIWVKRVWFVFLSCTVTWHQMLNCHNHIIYCAGRYGYDWKRDEANKNLLRTHTTAISSRMLYALAQVLSLLWLAVHFSIKFSMIVYIKIFHFLSKFSIFWHIYMLQICLVKGHETNFVDINALCFLELRKYSVQSFDTVLILFSLFFLHVNFAYCKVQSTCRLIVSV